MISGPSKRWRTSLAETRSYLAFRWLSRARQRRHRRPAAGPAIHDRGERQKCLIASRDRRFCPAEQPLRAEPGLVPLTRAAGAQRASPHHSQGGFFSAMSFVPQMHDHLPRAAKGRVGYVIHPVASLCSAFVSVKTQARGRQKAAPSCHPRARAFAARPEELRPGCVAFSQRGSLADGPGQWFPPRRQASPGLAQTLATCGGQFRGIAPRHALRHVLMCRRA